jgi:hypothetical protein
VDPGEAASARLVPIGVGDDLDPGGAELVKNGGQAAHAQVEHEGLVGRKIIGVGDEGGEDDGAGGRVPTPLVRLGAGGRAMTRFDGEVIAIPFGERIGILCAEEEASNCFDWHDKISLGRQCLGDEVAAVVHPVERDEAAHAGALAAAEEGFVERLEPVAEGFEGVALADFEDDVLDFVAGRVGGELGQFGVEVGQRGAFDLGRGAAVEGRGDVISGVVDGEADEVVEFGVGVGRRAGGVALDELPRGRLVADAGSEARLSNRP